MARKGVALYLEQFCSLYYSVDIRLSGKHGRAVCITVDFRKIHCFFVCFFLLCVYGFWFVLSLWFALAILEFALSTRLPLPP